jgi:hypothetical protein
VGIPYFKRGAIIHIGAAEGGKIGNNSPALADQAHIGASYGCGKGCGASMGFWVECCIQRV